MSSRAGLRSPDPNLRLQQRRSELRLRYVLLYVRGLVTVCSLLGTSRYIAKYHLKSIAGRGTILYTRI